MEPGNRTSGGYKDGGRHRHTARKRIYSNSQSIYGDSGGAKYGPIGKLGKNPVTGPEDLEATVDYVKSFSAPISYQTDGRIRTASATETPDDTGNQPGSGKHRAAPGLIKEKNLKRKNPLKPDAAEQPDQAKNLNVLSQKKQHLIQCSQFPNPVRRLLQIRNKAQNRLKAAHKRPPIA